MTGLQASLANIFMPYAMKKLEAAVRTRHKFVYYTSASTALSVIKNQEIWMRNARCMNDISEVIHGIERIERELKEGNGRNVIAALNSIHDGVGDEALADFRTKAEIALENTYITCVSEHNASEDRYGRLSMWRAYGHGSVGVAIVMRPEAFFSPTNALHAYASPVAYFTDKELAENFSEVRSNIIANRQQLACLKQQTMLEEMVKPLLFAITSLKHPGFKEEREWRVIHLPTIDPSPTLRAAIVDVQGIPQRVFKIPLKPLPQHGQMALNLDSLISHLIVGPTNYPTAIQSALVEALGEAGVSEPQRKVVTSDIPLRVAY